MSYDTMNLLKFILIHLKISSFDQSSESELLEQYEDESNSSFKYIRSCSGEFMISFLTF